jgi:hypothetical protein
MIPTLALFGLYLLLWVPFLGHLLQHGFGHVTAHVLDHHEHAFLVVLLTLFWGAVVGILLFALFGHGWLSLDCLLTLLLLFRLFSAGH